MMLKKMLEKSVFFEKIEISFNILDMSYSNFTKIYSFMFIKHLSYLISKICCLFEVTIQNKVVC